MRATTFVTGIFAALVGFAICIPLALALVGSWVDGELLWGILKGESAGSFNGISPTSYLTLLLDTPSFHRLIANSAFYTVAVLLGQLLVGVPAAWALARYRFRGRGMLFLAYVILMMLPFQATMLPNYLALQVMGINNTWLAVVLPGVFSAFPVFIMRQFFAAIPDNLIEAARLDGASEGVIFLRIGVPLGAPGVFAAIVLGFFEYWNLVEQPLAFLQDQALWPLSMYMPELAPENIGIVLAAAMVASIPAILVFLLGHDYLEKGIAATTKGEK